MESLNKVELIGRVGTRKDSEFGKTKLIRLSVVTESVYTSADGETIKDSTWHNVVVWDKGEYRGLLGVDKGTPVHIIGRLKYGKYTGKDGVERYTTDIVASSFNVYNPEPSQQTAPQETPSYAPAPQEPVYAKKEDDLPW